MKISPGDPIALTVDQVADLIGFGRSRIFEAIKAGELPVRTILGRRRVLRTDLELWLRNQPVENAPIYPIARHA
jgi:excisionase family DNA binding protein